jgi:plastocyanin
MRRIWIVFLLTLSGTVPVVLAHPSPVSAATHTVAIDGPPDCGTSMFCYSPSSLTVTAGDTVTWVNNSTASQTVTRCDPSACAGFGSGSGRQSGPTSRTIKADGGIFTFAFTRPGRYNYYSAVRGNAVLHGKITVVAAATTTTTTASTTTTTIERSRTAAAAQSTGPTVKIEGSPNCGTMTFCYVPALLPIQPGDTVTWVNDSTVEHTVTACGPKTCDSEGPGTGTQNWPASDTNIISPNGGTYSFTFTGIGTYNYYCFIHGFPMMHGTISVSATTTTTTTTGTSPTTTTTVAVASATASSSNSPGASTKQMAGTGAPLSEGVAVGLVLVLLGLGLTTASGALRRRSSERTCIAAPESSLTLGLLEDFEAEGSMQDPGAKVERGPSLE